jgi:hypothetical protein
MQHILTRQFLGGKYSKWIVILQEFDLEFERAKSKKSLVFAKLICDFPYSTMEKCSSCFFIQMNLFSLSALMIFGMVISSYISKPRLSSPTLSSTDRCRIRYQARQYIILGDTLYRRGIDLVFRCID